LFKARLEGIHPYCVYMGWNPSADYNRVSLIRFDDESHYACDRNAPTFLELVKKVENNWGETINARISYIPLVTIGWDKQPRKDNPVSWELDHGYHQQEVFLSTVKPEEIASHFSNPFHYITLNKEICKVNTIIIYAWNDNEGGWLIPTWSPERIPDTERLKLIDKVLLENE